MAKTNLFPESVLEPIGKKAAIATQKVKALKAELEEAEHFKQIWEDLLSYLNQGWPFHILALLEKEAHFVRQMRQDNDPTIRSLDEISRIAQEQTDSIRRRFPAYLEEACVARKLPLDRESRHPRYSFKGGFFQLEIDERKDIARLSDHEGPLDEFPTDIGVIVEIVEREYKRIFERSFDSNKFLKKLRHQYLAVVNQEGQSDGAIVPIRHITRRLGKNEKGFRTDEFLVDLSRLVEQGMTEIEGRRLDLQQTKDINQGMLLLGTAGRGYVGFILFKEV